MRPNDFPGDGMLMQTVRRPIPTRVLFIHKSALLRNKELVGKVAKELIRCVCIKAWRIVHATKMILFETRNGLTVSGR
jgi:hypothetical protein